MRLFVTGGAGFIGANYVHWLLANSDDHITVFDLTVLHGPKGIFLPIKHACWPTVHHPLVPGDLDHTTLWRKVPFKNH